MTAEADVSGPVFAESDLLPISALQHWAYCPRQAVLIHGEQLWADNLHTAGGNVLHARVHSGKAGRRKDRATARTLHVKSLALGLTGQCDAVEFTAPDGSTAEQATAFRDLPSLPEADRRGWSVVPVEYKRGRPKKNDCDRIQVAAQAVCLEEMLGVEIPLARLYYGQTKRRTDVPVDGPLRDKLAAAAAAFRAALTSGRTPPAEYSKAKCEKCSLIDHCMPRVLTGRRSASAWLRREIASPDEHEASASEEQRSAP